MAELAWEKSPEKVKQDAKLNKKSERWKFLLGGLLILAAIVYLMITSTVNGARFFITVDEVVSGDYAGQSVRLTGAVLGDSIEYDSVTGNLSFTIVHIPREFEDLAQTLHEAVNDSSLTQLQIVMNDTTMPDLLQHEAQAILTGEIGDDGFFHATELNLKCPTRFEEHTPNMLSDVRED